MLKPYGLAPDKMTGTECWSLLLTRLGQLEQGCAMHTSAQITTRWAREANALVVELYHRGSQATLDLDDRRGAEGAYTL